MAKLIAGYVNTSDNLQQLYHDIKTKKLRLDPIAKFDQNIKTQIYAGYTY